MPEPPRQDPRPNAPSEDLHNLLEEHLRLRGDIQKLMQQHQQLLEKGRNGNRQEQDLESKPQPGKEPEQGKKKEDEKEPPPKPPMRRRAVAWVRGHPLGTLLLLGGLVVALVAGYLLWRYIESYESTDDAEIAGHIAPVSSRISGTVIGVYTENDRSVVQNQTLVDLDPADYQAALAGARARLAEARGALESQNPNVPITQTTEATNVTAAQLQVANGAAALEAARQTYNSAQADFRQAEANAENAEMEARRYGELVAKDEVSREVYDQRTTQARAARDLVAARRASAEAAARTVEQRQAALAEANARSREAQANQPRALAVQRSTVANRRAAVAAAEAQVSQALLNLNYCKILAPMAGIVGAKTVEVGQQISPGQELLAITEVGDVWVTADFKETQIRDMRPGQAASIHVDALDLDFAGYVQNMPGATGATFSLLPPENATGNYVKVVQRLPVRLRFKPGQTGLDRLRPGMSVEPKVWIK